MGQIIIRHYAAFSAQPGKGNPAGAVLDAAGLSDEAMQRIAARVGFNETVFVLPSRRADLRLRYWTPGHEMDLCRHATVASFYALHERGLLPPRAGRLSAKTNVGVLPIGGCAAGMPGLAGARIEMA